MTLLDMHIWFWWCEGNPRLGRRASWLDQQPQTELAISVFSIWEIAKLNEIGKIALPAPVSEWIDNNLADSGVRLIPLSKEIAIEACNLPGTFHRDPADQIIAATARSLDCDLLTADARILSYGHVKAVAP